MRKVILMAAVLAVASVVAINASAIGIPAKAKAKKIQGNMVPAFKPVDSGTNTGDDENDSPAFLDAAAARSGCTLEQGQYKITTGGSTAVKLSGVNCGGTPFSGTLCAHTKILATILDEDIDKTGTHTPVTCPTSGVPAGIQGQTNFVTGNVGTITCTAGKCAGLLPVVTPDPCPSVDKVAEVRRVEVFDGPDLGSLSVLGSTLSSCCGPGQTAVGNLALPACAGSTQDVMATSGTITQGIVP